MFLLLLSVTPVGYGHVPASGLRLGPLRRVSARSHRSNFNVKFALKDEPTPKERQR